MRYADSDTIDLLAAQYVLGTLRGKARLRFERLIQQRSDIAVAVEFWETNLASLAAAVRPVRPPVVVWREISHAIRDERDRLRKSRSLWRVFGLFSSTAVAALALLFFIPAPIEDREDLYRPGHVAVVGEPDKPLWVISADLDTGLLSAHALNASAAGVDKVFELWMLPQQGQPVSLGLLPVNGGRISHSIPAGLLALLKQAQGLAISIEPEGGSPTGLPTGPVVQTAKMMEL